MRSPSPVVRLSYIALFLLVACGYLLMGGFSPKQLSQNQPMASMSLQAVAIGTGGAVTTEDPVATNVGITILAKGGNAIDAAVATAAALGVVKPFACGIGGGDFMVFKQADAIAQDNHKLSTADAYPKPSSVPPHIVTFDGREQAPASAFPEMFQDPESATGAPLPVYPNRISSGVAVGVPGALQTWAEALERYGTLSLAEALEPAIALADDGFIVDQTFHDHVVQNQERFAVFTSTRDLYLPHGAPPVVGSVFRNPELAHTYRLIAEQGINVFYRGDIGVAIAHTVQQPPTVARPSFSVMPGTMTPADLDNYHVRVRRPVSGTYHGYDIYGMGLPSSGGITTLQILNLLEGYDLGAMDRANAWHYVIEAERLAYGDRNAYLGDPEYVDVPVAGLLNKDYAQARRILIPPQAPANEPEVRASAGNPLPYQSDPSPSLTELNIAQANDDEGLSTTHLTVADQWGNVVSHTLTIESTGGSGIVVPGYGFLLNNELTDFNAIQPHPNSPEPGKRPRSSMAPTLILGPDGSVIAFGSPGGSTIITTVVGITVNMLDFGLSLPDAIAAPRLSQRNGGSTLVESNFENTEVGQILVQQGHHFEPRREMGAATGIVISPQGQQTAVAEPQRRGGGDARVLESPPL